MTNYAWLWINENLKFERVLRDQIDEIFKGELQYPQITENRPDKAMFGYKAVLILLGLVSLAATSESIF